MQAITSIASFPLEVKGRFASVFVEYCVQTGLFRAAEIKDDGGVSCLRGRSNMNR